jgi:oligopeptide/dipeptide ABC transporter ATP-binding protein
MDGLAVEIGGRVALRDVNLEVPAGRCIALVGETGSGKSMTCRVAVGLLARIGGNISHGSLHFDERDMTAASDRQWRAIRGRRIGMIPQGSFSALDPIIRVGRQLEETVRVLDPDGDVSARVDELLESVQLLDGPSVRRAYSHQLSGGMRQRVMIALALAGRPDLLLADEATTALDVTIQRGILALLRQRQEHEHMALLLVTHDLSIVRSIADSVTIMYAGTTVESGPVESVFSQPQHPYTRALLAARPGSVAARTRLPSIEGAPPGLGERLPGCVFVDRCPIATPACRDAAPLLEPVTVNHAAACFYAPGAQQ